MPTKIVQILHLTDLHLLVDALGNQRLPHQRAQTLRRILYLLSVVASSPSPYAPQAQHLLQKAQNGLAIHKPSALKALRKTLETIVNAHGPEKVIVIQSGDLEAYGATGNSLSGWTFPSFDFWEGEVQKHLGQVDKFIDIYGNHDVWPGTVPFLAPLHIQAAELALRARPTFRSLMPSVEIIDADPYQLEIYRINTVQTGIIKNIVEGAILHTRVGTYPLSGGTDPVAELIELARRANQHSPTKKIIRLLVMHHPPYFFAVTNLMTFLTEGRLLNADDLLPALKAFRFHFVVAGHRHTIDPAPGTMFRPVQTGQPQPPLPWNTVQVVAGSPTQKVPAGADRPSFSLYEIYADDTGNQLRLDRTLYRFLNDSDTDFTLDQAEPIVDGLPVL